MASIALIINADDLGMSPEVNDATFDLMSKGRISSATILANAPATRQAARLISAFPRCSFGVHLNVTQFEPLTGGSGARLLIDERGQMSRANEAARLGPERLQAVYQELSAQVEYVASLGVRVSHLDSHHHVHTRPAFFPALKAVQRRYRLRRVRLAKNFYSSHQPCPADLVWKKRAYNCALTSVYTTHTTDAFTELVTYYYADAARQRSIGVIELMVHPGAAYAAEETAILESDWTARMSLPVQLISYAALSDARDGLARRAWLRRVWRPCA
jgi:chitin disaccharide deacetylase